MSGRRTRTVLALGLLTAFDVVLVGARMHHSGRFTFWYLLWNLFLAWIPFVLALALYDASRRRRQPALLAVLAAGWLLFFPNAPYILTDVIHLAPEQGVPLWFDALTITSAALTGLLLGFVSLGLVQEVVRRAAGAVWAWILAGGVLVIASVGIYLGRFLRLNSWDVVTRPHELVYLARIRLADPLGNPKLILVVGLMSAFLAVAYAVFSALWDAGESRVPEQRTPR
ncbi:MAG: DUF1361 domain-containing protein [Actinobacteria bacterium]|nr:MAG: DUF1361 domain-containing protein [Actinomycetota bacterium]